MKAKIKLIETYVKLVRILKFYHYLYVDIGLTDHDIVKNNLIKSMSLRTLLRKHVIKANYYDISFYLLDRDLDSIDLSGYIDKVDITMKVLEYSKDLLDIENMINEMCIPKQENTIL